MRPSTSHRYFERIARVVDALLARPADAHSVESLAAVANMSAFHFHRVFRTMMGETVSAKMRRVRLSLAADRLAGGGESVERIAQFAGYESPQAFARAFRGFAHSTPAEFRRRNRIGCETHPLPAVGSDWAEAIDIVNEPALHVLALRHDGPVSSISCSAQRFWRWQLRRALLPRVRQVIGAIYLDTDDPRGFRYYSAVAVDSGDRTFDDVTTLSLPGGRYARYRLHGPGPLIAPTFYAMQRHWLPGSAFELDTRPARPLLERYVNQSWMRGDDAGPVVDLLIPVRLRTNP